VTPRPGRDRISHGRQVRLIRTAVILVLVVAGGWRVLASLGGGSSQAGPSSQANQHRPVASVSANGPTQTTSPSPGRVRIAATVAPFTLPQALARAVVFTDGSTLLVAGGETASGSTSMVWRINPANAATSVFGHLVRPGHDAAGAAVPQGFLIFGGGSVDSVNTVQRLGLDGGAATVVGHLPRPRSDLVAATAGSVAYVLGGYDGSILQTSVLATSDGRSFRAVAKLPVPVRYAAMVVSGGALYLFGGDRASGRPTDVVQEFDPATGAALVIGHLPVALGHASALNLRGTVLVAGGRDSNGALRKIWSFDPARRTFRAVGALPTPLSDASAVVVGSVGYLVGGENTVPVRSVAELRTRR
jgi:Galactose oxidase, central domain/Kelch motif